jgi:hypothetical protein
LQTLGILALFARSMLLAVALCSDSSHLNL